MGNRCGCFQGLNSTANLSSARAVGLGSQSAQFLTARANQNAGKHPNDLYDMKHSTKLGDGAFGTVKMAKNRQTQQEVAMKTIAKRSVKDLPILYNEIRINQMMDHPNIARMYETFEDKQFVWIAMEVCSGGEMFDMIVEQGKFKESEAAALMEQIMRAMVYMHHKCVAHRDLKPENFLLQKKKIPLMDNKVKVIDFGIAREFEKGPDGEGLNCLKTKAGTAYYIAPEILSGRKYNEKCDVWSCGVILYILLSGAPPFAGDKDQEIMANVKKGHISFHDRAFNNVTQQAKDWIKKCCTMDVKERFRAEQALNDTWILDKAKHTAGALDMSVIAKLKSFSGVSRFKKAALNIIAFHVDDNVVKLLASQFHAMDKNGDGELTIEEMQSACQVVGLSDISQVTALFNSMDVDKSGTIGYSEFVAAMLEHKQTIKREQCWEAFRVFDQDGNGRITMQEFDKIIRSYGSHLPESAQCVDVKEMEAMFKEADTDGNGEIDFEEFVSMMQK